MSITQNIVTRPVPAAPGLAGLPPLLQRLYAARGVVDQQALDYSLTRLPDYTALRGMTRACDLLEAALAEGRRILVVGDFDADGATSSALVCDALAAMGAACIECFIPNRVEHGYGLSPQVIAAIHAQGGEPGLLITVDNGISSHAGVEAARAEGWHVVVTDHHLPGDTLPAADAIINPNQPGCGAFGRNLAGVGVAFYLMVALRGRLRRNGHAGGLPHMGDYLDLVAVGTVADVVPLDYLNRLLVAQGLRRIHAGRARPGVAALIAAAKRDAARLTPADIGFGIAPRLNAAGRLDDMREGVACLRATQRSIADQYAMRLNALNEQRRMLQADMQAEAQQALERHDAPAALADGLVVFDGQWHEGIVGLLAGRLCERYKRPIVAFACAGDDGFLKGSARSMQGIHIRDVLAAMDAADPGLIVRFGGHARAAGLTLERGRLDDFRAAFSATVGARLTPAMCNADIVTDGTLKATELSLSTALCLRAAGPWGSGFEAPVFHGEFDVVSQHLLKGAHLKLVVCPHGSQIPIDAIAFNQPQAVEVGDTLSLVYRLEVNHFRGADSANLIVEHLRLHTDMPRVPRRHE